MDKKILAILDGEERYARGLSEFMSKKDSLPFRIHIFTEAEKFFSFKGNEEIPLTSKEFEIIRILMENPGKVYKRNDLLTAVWGDDFPGDERTVDVHVRRLREKIESNPGEPLYVQTKWGSGYYYKEP